MPFPVSPRYFLNFRNSDTGLTPSFLSFKNAATFANIAPPSITESPAGGGTYYFDWTWTTTADADIVFEVDGGASIPTEEVRYIKATISPRDRFLDEPISQVVQDVWNDVTNRAVGTKGDFVEHIGTDADAVDDPTVFGKVYKARDAIMGGTGFGGTGVDVKTTYDRVGAPLGGFSTIADQLGDPSGANSIAQDIIALQFTANTLDTKIGTPAVDVSADIAAVKTVVDTINTETDPTAIADAVWDANTAGNTLPGTMGGLVNDTKAVVDTINVETDAASIADAVWDATTAGNIGPGTMGGLVNDAATGTAPSAATVAAAVWDKATSSHTLPGSFGQTLQLLNNDTAAAGSLTTITLGASAVGTADFYKNALLVLTGGTGAGQARAITAYTALKVATVDRDWGITPDNTSEYIIIPAANVPVDNASIADAVWDEALAGHLTAGSTGEKLNAPSVDNAAIADAVWDEATAGHATAGTYGKQATDTKTAVDAINIETDAASIANAVWDASTTGNITGGTMGGLLNSAGTAYVQFKANGDTENPIIIQVSSPKHTQVKITFSEPVVMTNDPNGALKLENYSIPGLTIISVAPLTAQQVMLTTSPQTPDFLYSLSVINVEDLSGNPIL